MSGQWLVQSLIASVLLVPTWLAIGFFKKNYAISPDVFLVWYFIGVVITTALVGVSSNASFNPPIFVIIAMVLVGLTLGAICNILVFRAVATAPNPGMALAIVQIANVGVLFASIYLGRAWPAYFEPVKIDWISIFSTLLVIVGVVILVIRK